MPRLHRVFSWFLSVMLAVVTPTVEGCNKSAGNQQAQSPASNAANAQAPAATYAKPSPDELYQLVAPIALFPDNLVAQVLAGSTYPDQIASASSSSRRRTAFLLWGLRGIEWVNLTA